MAPGLVLALRHGGESQTVPSPSTGLVPMSNGCKVGPLERGGPVLGMTVGGRIWMGAS